MVYPTEMIPTPSPVPEILGRDKREEKEKEKKSLVPDLLSAAWDEVKVGLKGGSVPVDRRIDTLCANENFSMPAEF